MTEVATLAELQRWKRRELIRDLEKIVGAAASGPVLARQGRDHHQE